MSAKLARKIRRNMRRFEPRFNLVQPAMPSVAALPTAYDLVACLQPKTLQPLIAALFGTVVLVSSYIFVLSPQGYVARHELEDYIDARSRLADETLTRNVALSKQIAALEDDDVTIEEIARDALSMARADETIYRIAEEGPAAYVLNP